MPRRRYTAEHIMIELRQAEVELARGQTMPEVCRKFGTGEQTYYRWRKEYAGVRVDHMKRLKALELENCRLRMVVADEALALVVLKETAERRANGAPSGPLERVNHDFKAIPPNQLGAADLT